MKYGLVVYKNTDNLGDDILSYASSLFLPSIDYVIDREEIDTFLPDKIEPVKVILNGWFLHNKFNWPPSEYIIPLLIGVHFSGISRWGIKDEYLDDIGSDYLRAYSPIGCRDIYTAKKLEERGIEAYFSGCVTFALSKFENVKKTDKIVLVDVSDRVSKFVQKKYSNVEFVSHYIGKKDRERREKLLWDDRKKEIEATLKKYQEADIVITSRLHCALPCLALGTKVIMIKRYDSDYKNRIGSYEEMLCCMTEDEVLNSNLKKIDFNARLGIDDLRRTIIDKCNKFVSSRENDEIVLPEISECAELFNKKLLWQKMLVRHNEKIDTEEFIETIDWLNKQVNLKNEEIIQHEKKERELLENYEKLKFRFDNLGKGNSCLDEKWMKEGVISKFHESVIDQACANSENIKVYIAYHKECTVYNGNFFYPIQVGAANSPIRFADMLHDDIGDNISLKNRSYGEMTAQYWAWKNDIADYYGFFHYRRFLSFSKEKFPVGPFGEVEMKYFSHSNVEKLNLKPDVIKELVCSNDIITVEPVRLHKLNPPLKNNYQQYINVKYEHGEDIEEVLRIIKNKSPQMYSTAYDYFYKLSYGYLCNMFIMKKDIFFEYCEWVFGILEEFEKNRDYSQYSIDGERVCGYLGERLFGVFFEYKKRYGKINTCELQRVLFCDMDIIQQPYIALEDKDVPIAIASNDYFAPYVCTLLLSIIDNASIDRNYKFFILTHDMSKDNRIRLSAIVEEISNATITFIDPDFLLEDYNLYIKEPFSEETYYRLVLPEVFSTVKKMVYLDADMIVKADIAELFDTDMEGFLVAATYDADSAGLYNGFFPDKKEYVDKVLKMHNPYHYFQAGTLVINLEEFRKTVSTKDILNLAVSQEWELFDQDILNILCEGKVKFIDMSWNVMYDWSGIRLSQIVRLAPRWLYDMYVEAKKNPKIIHYAGSEKPWQYPECDFGVEFWKYAKKTDYYEVMLYRMSEYAAAKRIKEVDDDKNEFRKKNQNPFFKTIRCLRIYGLRHTLNEIKRELL